LYANQNKTILFVSENSAESHLLEWISTVQISLKFLNICSAKLNSSAEWTSRFWNSHLWYSFHLLVQK